MDGRQAFRQPCHMEQLHERAVHMQSKLDEMFEQAARPSAFEDVLVGIGTVVAAFAIGRVFALPEIVRELVVGEDGAVVIGAVLMVMAILLGGLLSILHALRRLSREVATSGRLRQRTGPSPTLLEGRLLRIENDDNVSLVPGLPGMESAGATGVER
jgi:hypothetical protein